MSTGSISYKGHLLPRLRASTEDAGGYIAANLKDNADSPETIALAFQDVIQAYGLPIEVSTGERARLEREVVKRAKEFTDDKEPRDNWNALVAYRELCRAVDSLLAFESSHSKALESKQS